MTRAASRGISLLEAIVALVVLSGFGAALFAWAAQNTEAVRRAVEAQTATEIERNVTELAAALNPAMQPQGRIDTAMHRYEWTSEPARGPSDQIRHPVGNSPWQAGLWRVTVTVTALQPAAAPALRTERLVAGFTQVRPRGSGLMGEIEPPPPRR